MSRDLLNTISFPVFRIGYNKPLSESGLSLYLLGKDIEYSDAEYSIKIVDDKNIPAPTLSARRIVLLGRGAKLFPLKRAVFFIGDLIKLADSKTWFIDSTGLIFQYKKSIRVPLVFKKIKQTIPIATGGAIIEVEGIATRFKVLHAPNLEQQYAGILRWKKSCILYGLYDKKYSDTTRNI